MGLSDQRKAMCLVLCQEMAAEGVYRMIEWPQPHVLICLRHGGKWRRQRSWLTASRRVWSCSSAMWIYAKYTEGWLNCQSLCLHRVDFGLRGDGQAGQQLMGHIVGSQQHPKAPDTGAPFCAALVNQVDLAALNVWPAGDAIANTCRRG